MLKHRILLMNDGLDHNVIKIKPPLCFTKDNADAVLQAIDETLGELLNWTTWLVNSLSKIYLYYIVQLFTSRYYFIQNIFILWMTCVYFCVKLVLIRSHISSVFVFVWPQPGTSGFSAPARELLPARNKVTLKCDYHSPSSCMQLLVVKWKKITHQSKVEDRKGLGTGELVQLKLEIHRT